MPSPFGHVDVVRALGLEPSLFRGKSPVPYQSGVTRDTMPLQLSRSWFVTGDPVPARPEGVEPPAVGVGDRGATVTRARVDERA